MTSDEFKVSFGGKSTIGVTFLLIKNTLGFLRSHPKFIPPLVISFLAPALSFLVVSSMSSVLPQFFQFFDGLSQIQLVFVGIFGFLTVAAVIVFSVNVVLVSATNRALHSQETSLLTGTKDLLLNLPHVVLHGIITGFVGALFLVLERESSSIAGLAALVLGASYEVASFFVLQAAVVDGEGPLGMFSRSAEVVFDRFGETNFVSFGMLLVLWWGLKMGFNLFLIIFWIPILIVLVTESLLIASLMGFLFNDPRGIFLSAFLLYIPIGLFVVGISILSVTKTLVYVDTVESVKPDGIPDNLYGGFDYMNTEVYDS
jgi:hypothetical protein